MNGANIGSCAILLNGPSSAGKSSIAEELRKKLDEAGLTVRVISIDDYMKISTDEEIWEDDVYETVPEMSRDISAAVGRGETVIIDHAITSKRIFDAMIASAAGGDLKLVLVECSAEVLRQREAARGNRFAGSAEASLKYLYPKDGYDLTVNTERNTAQECSGQIFREFFRT